MLRTHSLAELVRLGTMTGQCASFLEASVVAGLNIATAGATSAGNITLLDILERHLFGARTTKRLCAITTNLLHNSVAYAPG